MINPSHWQVWFNCAGSMMSEAVLPKLPRLERGSTKEGVFAHSVASRTILKQLRSPEEVKIPDMEDGQVVSSDMKNKLQPYVDKCVELFRRSKQFSLLRGCLYVETKTKTSEVHELLSNGYVDYAVYDEAVKTLYVLELKYGYTPVKAEGNIQMLLYAASICREKGIRPEKIILAVYQPNVEVFRGTAWDVIEYTFEDVSFLVGTETAWRLDDALTNDPRLRPGKHCRRCSAAPSCAEHREYMLSAIDQAEGYVPPVNPDTEYLVYQLEQIESLVNKAKQFEAILLEYVEKRLLNGESVPGFGYIPSLGNRAVLPDKKEELLKLAADQGVDVLEQKLVTPAEMERRGLNVEKYTYRPDIGRKVKRINKEKTTLIFGGTTDGQEKLL